MDSNSLFEGFDVNFGDLFGDIGNKYAQSKGYGNVYDLATGEAAKNLGRLTDKPGEDVKQTPAVIQPGAWSQEISKALPFEVSLSNTQLMLAGLVAVGVIVLLIKR